MTSGARRPPFGLLAAIFLILSCCAGEAAGPGGTPELAISARAVEIIPERLTGLRLRSAVALDADHQSFGGFSGLRMDNGHLIAIGDAGWWLLADLIDGPEGMVPISAGFVPMRGEDGETFDKAGGDAEGLTTRDGNLVVSFERDHRIMFHVEEGQLGDTLRHGAFETLSSNKGLEALATTPDGWLLAIGESQYQGGHRMFLVRYSGEIIERSLPAAGDFFVTGADVGPDGRLYVLLRDYQPLVGVSIRIDRYELGGDGFPMIDTRVTLAEFESSGGIDNMEGISLWRDAGGLTHLTMISDDNFSALQRTLLVDLEVLE